MKKTWLAALAAIAVLAAGFSAFAETFPPYLVMEGTIVRDYYDTLPAELVIPDGVTSIGKGAFEDCESLTSVTIPSSVTSIGDSAFNDCENLKEIKFKGTKAQWQAIKGSGDVNVPCIRFSDGYIGVETIPEYLRMNGTEVKKGDTYALPAELVIPDGVTSIGNEAFYECKSLKSVTIPGSVTSIGNRAFSGCRSLTSVTIGNGVTSIGSSAFGYCNSLTSVTIGNGVTSIGDYAFSYCNNLTSVTIPDSVTSIGGHVFYGCNIKEVKYAGTKAQWEKIKNGRAIGKCVVHCTDGDISVGYY